MDQATANNILKTYELPPSKVIKKIDVGFTNTVYDIDGIYILKICTDTAGNEAPFRLEANLYDFYKFSLPVPQLIAFNTDKIILPYSFMLYPKIVGDNLYNVWHTLSVEQRRLIVKQLCVMLRTINNTDLAKLPLGKELEPVTNWRSVIDARLNKYLGIADQMQTLSPVVIGNVRQFIADKISSLDEQKLALTYWDVHFDNILVSNERVVGLLDFERTEIASIDFVLDTAKRMVDYPKKYMSEYAEQFAKDEDYKDLLDWYKEFYPELFKFEQLDKRLALYSIAHDLEDLENWPNVQQLKDNIQKTIAT